MRIEAIENPQGSTMKRVYESSRRKFGKVITPVKVVSAHVPGIVPVYHEITGFMSGPTSLGPSLRLLIQCFTAGLNQCNFCLDISRSFASDDPALLEKAWRVSHYATDPIFSEAERAALAYIEEITRTHDAGDAVFEALKPHFDDRQIVEITLVNAIEHFYNLVNRPLGIESDGLCAVQPGTRQAAEQTG